MIFYSAYGQRPVRLSQETRAFAWESMHGKYGDEAVVNDSVSMDDVPGYTVMSDAERYDACLRRIAETAPLRICSGERLCGAATLGLAIRHCVPARYHGEPAFSSVSHVTLGFDRAVTRGMDALLAEVEDRLADPGLTEKERGVLLGMRNAGQALRIWHARYLAELANSHPELCETLRRVPFSPPESFREALQSLWFLFSFTRLMGNWSGLGRIDQYIGPYLERDLANGVITREEARELTASFFIKGCEWIQSNTPVGTGDAQHYQNIVLSGVNEDGNEGTNTLTYLILDVVEELGISDFPITMRFGDGTPEHLITRVAQVMRHGGGVLAIYNEPLILRAFQAQGYTLRDARSFANDGCWEVQVPGRTCFGYVPFDSLQLLQKNTLRLDTGEPAEYASFEALYDAFLKELGSFLHTLYAEQVERRLKVGQEPGRWLGPLPTPVIDLFTGGCCRNARGYYDFGPDFTVLSPHLGGMSDTVNSLYAIKKLVFDDGVCSFHRLMRAVAANWDGEEDLRLQARNAYRYYGNDNEACDGLYARLLNDFADLVGDCDSDPRVHFIPGVSTFGRQVDWLPFRTATPFGAKKGEILAGNASPTPGTDEAGATAVIRSYCRADLGRMESGTALDLKIHPSVVRGERGTEALVSLMKGFLALGGFFLQPDVMDAEVLRCAQKHPEEYKTLSVRVSGWNARFVTLNREWQEMIIERTSQTV